jgi:hypothetical protein
MERQQQPYDPEYPAGKPPGGSERPDGTQEQEQKKRVLWVQSRQIPAPPGAQELNLMTLPASAAIDIFISYTQPSTAQTIKSPDGRERFRLYANEQLTSRQLVTFTPGGHVPGGGGNTLPVVGRIFAIRDFPADGWQLTIDTSLLVPDPDAPPTLVLNITCVGWAREPTGIGPLELQTLQAAAEKDDTQLSFVAVGGLSAVNVPAFGLVPIYNVLSAWTPDPSDLAGAQDVIICGVDPSGEILPLSTNFDGSLQASPSRERTNFTTALADSLVVIDAECIILGGAGRLDSTAPTGTYYVQLWKLAAAPANGTAVTAANGAIMAPLKIQHSSGADDYFDFEFPDGGVLGDGFTVTLSSTEFTKSASPGSYMSATGTYKPV